MDEPDYEYQVVSFPQGFTDQVFVTTSLLVAERKYDAAVENGAFPILSRREVMPWETIKNSAHPDVVAL